MDQSFLDSVLKATKDYWFLITLVASIVLTLAYMIVFRVNPWDQQRSVKLRRDRVRFHNGVGYSLIESGHFTEALGEFEEALKLSAEDQTALNGKYLANLFINIGSPTADPAIGFAIQRRMTETDGLKREQHLHIIDKYLGDLHIRISNFPKATQYYRSALDRKPDYPDALLALGWQHYQADGDIDAMEGMFRKLTEIDPYDFRGYHGLGYALYMKAIREPDAEGRSSLIREASVQSGRAKDLVFNQLNIVMDFGEVSRSVNPELSLFYHGYGKKIMSDPTLRDLGDNRYPLVARLLMTDNLVVDVEGKEGKQSWIAYLTALDYLAMERMFDDPKYAAEHKRLYEKAQRLDPDKIIHHIYADQLKILDLLLPAKEVNDETVSTSE
ncbi:MAG TPA: hypothetical protein VFZ23_16670 [Pyrinomonadaceae bacterium]